MLDDYLTLLDIGLIIQETVLSPYKTNIASIAKGQRTTHGQRHRDFLSTLLNMRSTYTANLQLREDFL